MNDDNATDTPLQPDPLLWLGLSEGLGPLVERIGSPPDTHCWDEDSAADCWSYSPAAVAALLDEQRERLAKACEAEHVGCHMHDEELDDEDLAYNNGVRDCASAVRRA